MDEKSKRDQKEMAKQKELSEEMQFGSSKVKRKCMIPRHTTTHTRTKFARMDSYLMRKGASGNKSTLNSTRAIKSPMATKVRKDVGNSSKSAESQSKFSGDK